MVDTLHPLTRLGEYERRRWRVGYVSPYRYATLAIEIEGSPGQWLRLPNFEDTSWCSEEEMLAAVELRVRAHLSEAPPGPARAA